MALVYTVAQLNRYIKNMFSNDYLLRNVQIKGELSNVKYHSSGHIYFTLKEAGSAIAGVMFASARAQGLDFKLENGQSVIVSGNVSVYERDGKYQIYAREIEKEGIGSLYEEYERLKQKLYDQGLFDFEHKKEIPRYPKKVGIVTAATGAAIQDIMNIAKRRNPFVQLYLYPACVQGEGAAETIVKGIEALDSMGMDTIIVGRGGGSIEDLWPFNEEAVALAIYRAKTPIISGVGHEVDTTIADYAADLRAPTPSAACELAIPDVISLLRRTTEYRQQMRHAILRCMEQEWQRFEVLSARLYRSSPTYRIKQNQQRMEVLGAALNQASPMQRMENQKMYLDHLQEQLKQVMSDKLEHGKNRYTLLLCSLNGLSPTAKLTGGYGYIENDAGNPVMTVGDVREQESVRISIHDGEIEGIVTKIKERAK